MTRTYTASELSELTGLPVRTIEYYRSERLLSPLLPRRGNGQDGIYRGYTPLHLTELRKIQEITDARRTIADIRDMVHPETDDE